MSDISNTTNDVNNVESNSFCNREIYDKENGLHILVKEDGTGELDSAGDNPESDLCVVPGYVKEIPEDSFRSLECYSEIILSPGVTTIRRAAFKDAYIQKLVVCNI